MWMPLGWVSASGAGGAAASFELISTTLVSSSVASVTLTLPGSAATTYKHLQVRYTALSGQANWCLVRFNSDATAANYYSHYMHGNGTNVTSAASVGQPTGMNMMFIAGATIPSAGVMDVLDAFSTNKNKTTRFFHGYSPASGAEIVLSSGAWFSTNAISTLEFTHGSSTFSSGTRFSVYGVRG